MYVERVLSLNDGWSILTSQKEEEWGEALLALEVINDEYLSDEIKKVSPHAYIEYMYTYIYSLYKMLIENDFDWHAETPVHTLLRTNHMTNPIKNGVLASIAGVNDLVGFSFSNLLCKFLHI